MRTVVLVFLMGRKPPRSTLTDTRLPYTTPVRVEGRRPRRQEGRTRAHRRRARREEFAVEPRGHLGDAIGLVGGRAAGRDAGFQGSVRQLARGWRQHRARYPRRARSEEHTSELQSLMRISYAVFCLKKKILHQH